MSRFQKNGCEKFGNEKDPKNIWRRSGRKWRKKCVLLNQLLYIYDFSQRKKRTIIQFDFAFVKILKRILSKNELKTSWKFRNLENITTSKPLISGFWEVVFFQKFWSVCIRVSTVLLERILLLEDSRKCSFLGEITFFFWEILFFQFFLIF